METSPVDLERFWPNPADPNIQGNVSPIVQESLGPIQPTRKSRETSPIDLDKHRPDSADPNILKDEPGQRGFGPTRPTRTS